MSDVTKSEYPDYAYIIFDDICDIIGPSEQWPKKIFELFWSRNVVHWDRFMLCTFIVVNGLNPEIFLKWIDVTCFNNFLGLPERIGNFKGDALFEFLHESPSGYMISYVP